MGHSPEPHGSTIIVITKADEGASGSGEIGGENGRDQDHGDSARREAIQWISPDSEHRKNLDTKRFTAAMAIAAEQLLAKFPKTDTRSEGQQLYTAALLFSSMLFMTAGYGDIIPNSIMTNLIMFVQFVVYIISFVILLPQLR